MSAPRLELRRLRPDAVLPRYMSAAAAGCDVTAAIDEAIRLAPGARAAVGTGWAIAVPNGYEAQVRPRSGLALRLGLTVANSPGTIDADYRGELMVLLVNLGAEPAVIEPGQRIAQLVVAPVVQVAFDEVDELARTERGAGGFGSTGTREA